MSTGLTSLRDASTKPAQPQEASGWATYRSDAVLHVVGGIGVRGSIGHCHLSVVLGLVVCVGDHDTDGSPQCDPIPNA